MDVLSISIKGPYIIGKREGMDGWPQRCWYLRPNTCVCTSAHDSAAVLQITCMQQHLLFLKSSHRSTIVWNLSGIDIDRWQEKSAILCIKRCRNFVSFLQKTWYIVQEIFLFFCRKFYTNIPIPDSYSTYATKIRKGKHFPP